MLLLMCVPVRLHAADRADIVVADFEGEDYGAWTVKGEAFGRAPARGTLPGQMPVTGFEGRGLVNSFLGGDATTGTLTSPLFRIDRPYINFLLGGGHHPGETCLNLLVDGKVVRTVTGPNKSAGGTERLDWAAWDVRDLAGKSAVLEIVDRNTGGWGHINIDQIVQSDCSRGIREMERELVVESRYLHLPVRDQATDRRVRIDVDGKTTHEFDIKLAEGKPDFWVFCDVGTLKGKRLKLTTTLPEGSRALEQIVQADELPDAKGLYTEAKRPQFHFTSLRGWLNDPNGLVWHDGEYHLFYQHNPYGWDWGNMHWGHAVSRDLVRWKELPIALYPKQYGDWCFSGSAVADLKNTSGFGKTGAPPLVAAFTSTGRGECIVSSTDGGRTWVEFSGNPVIKHQGRDPRLLWHEPTTRWVMAVYDEGEKRQSIDFYSSPDLKAWTYESRIDGFFECPDLFELSVNADPQQKLWVLYAADGAYRLGHFDGHTFTPQTEKLRLWYGDLYAAQTFSNTPDGRRIQIGWGRIAFPGMPFNQQMTIPCELTLRKTEEGVRMFAQPVTELDSLRESTRSFKDVELRPKQNLFDGIAGDTLRIRLEAEVPSDATLTLNVRGLPIVYDAAKNRITCGDLMAPLAPLNGAIRLDVMVDRGSVEVFGNDGRLAISRAMPAAGADRAVSLVAAGGPARIRSASVQSLRSAWK